ncbi:MAG: hypothetical protein Q9227_009338 [Pyrenula ochraceoflavens]
MAPTLPTTLLHTISTHTAPINAISFSSPPSHTYLLTGSSDRSIHLTRALPQSSSSSTSPNSPQPPPPTTTTTTPIATYSAHAHPILSLTISPQNTTFASSGGDRTLFLWDVSTTQTIRRFSPQTSSSHTAKINAVTFAGDGGESVLISGSDDTTVRIWDLRSRSASPVMTLSDARDAISCLAVAGSPSGGRSGAEFLSGSVDGRVRSYDLRTGHCTTDTFPSPVTCLRLTRDGRAMLVSTLDSRIRLMDRGTGQVLQSFSGDGYRNEEVRLKAAMGCREEVVVVGSEGDGRVRGWEVVSGEGVGGVEVCGKGWTAAAAAAAARAGKKGGKGRVGGGEGGERGKEKEKEKEKVGVVSVVEWRGEGGLGDVWAAAGVDGKVRVYGDGAG